MAAALTVVGGLVAAGMTPAVAEFDLRRGLDRAGYAVSPPLKEPDIAACQAEGRREAKKPENQPKIERMTRSINGGGVIVGALFGFVLAGPGGAVAMGTSNSNRQASAVTAEDRFVGMHVVTCMHKKGYKFVKRAGSSSEPMPRR